MLEWTEKQTKMPEKEDLAEIGSLEEEYRNAFLINGQLFLFLWLNFTGEA